MATYEVDFDLYVHVRGTAELDFKPDSPNDLADFIFSDEGYIEIMDVMKDPNYCERGYMDITTLDDEDEE